MGYMMMMGTCGNCGRPFMSNPNYVPSLRHPQTGQQLIFCRECCEAATPVRAANGLPPIEIHPLAFEPEEA